MAFLQAYHRSCALLSLHQHSLLPLHLFRAPLLHEPNVQSSLNPEQSRSQLRDCQFPVNASAVISETTVLSIGGGALAGGLRP